MKLEWDERKRRSNLVKHGIDFADLEPLFGGLTITINDERFDYPEPRYLTVGFLKERLLLVVHTEAERVIRIISARKATSHEKKLYLSQLRH